MGNLGKQILRGAQDDKTKLHGSCYLIIRLGADDE